MLNLKKTMSLFFVFILLAPLIFAMISMGYGDLDRDRIRDRDQLKDCTTLNLAPSQEIEGQMKENFLLGGGRRTPLMIQDQIRDHIWDQIQEQDQLHDQSCQV
jgi:hypothetical protein